MTDMLIDGLNAAEHAAEDIGQAGGHGASFADTAAHPDGAPPHSGEAAGAAHTGEASSSWWDRAVSGVKSAAGSVDSAVHSAGHAVDQAAEAGIAKTTDAVRSVAGDRAASFVHGAAEGVRDQAKQTAGFVYGAGAGATEALGGMVEGTGNLVRSGAKFATDSQFRGQVVHGAEKLGSEVAQHPLASARALGSGVVHSGEDWLRGAGKAAQEGNLGEYVGRGAGSAVVNVGSFFIPGADVAEGANVASHLGEAGELASGAARALETGGKVAEEAGTVERAAGGAEHAAAGADHATETGEGVANHTAASAKRPADALEGSPAVKRARIADDTGEASATAARTEAANVGRNEASWTLDGQGRPVEVNATLRESFSKLERTPDELKAQDAVRGRADARKPGDARGADDAGHIIGHRFMPGQGERNMFPQHFNFNRGAYKTMENEWEGWTSKGAEVHVRAKFEGGTADRPARVNIEWEVRNAEGEPIKSRDITFDNEANQTYDRVPSKDMNTLLR